MPEIFNQMGNYFTAWAPQLMSWLFWGLIGALILGGIAALYFLSLYKYKVYVFERRGSGTDEYYIGKIKTDRARPLKGKDGVLRWKLLKANRYTQAIPDKYVYSNNIAFLFRVKDDIFVPFKVACGNPSGSFIPIDDDTRMWMMNEIKQAMMDYQVKSAWEQYSAYALMAGTILFCLILVGVVIYFTFKFAGGGTDAMRGLTSALQNFGGTVGAPAG